MRPALIAFKDIPLKFPELLSLLSATGILTFRSDFNPIIFLLVPFIFIVNRNLREKIASKLKLARFLEPFLVTWLFTSLWYVPTFAFSKILNWDQSFQSSGAFLVLFVIIGTVIYRMKGMRPIFFEISKSAPFSTTVVNGQTSAVRSVK